MTQETRKVNRALILGLLLWAAGGAIYSVATARQRFAQRLDQMVWALEQRSESAEPLNAQTRKNRLNDLLSREPTVRWAAAAQLGLWADREAVPALIAAMQDDGGTRRTCVIAQSLGEIGSPEAVPPLIAALEHPRNLDLRVCATHALVGIGDKRALAPLQRKALEPDQPRDDRVAAVRALGDLGFAEAVPALRSIAEQNVDRALASLARGSLSRIEIVQADDPVPQLLAMLRAAGSMRPGEWLFRQLDRYWDDRVAEALNDYLSAGAHDAEHLLLAAALLRHHEDIDLDTIQVLARADNRQQQWLAEHLLDDESPQHFASTGER